MTDIGKRVKSLLSTQTHGVLAVIDRETGIPYAAYVNFACASHDYPVFLISSLSRHVQALSANPQASLLVANLPEVGDVLTGERASFLGLCSQVEASVDLEHAYLASHPYAAGYIGFADFSFWQLVPQLVHTVAGFGMIATLSAAEVFGL